MDRSKAMLWEQGNIVGLKATRLFKARQKTASRVGGHGAQSERVCDGAAWVVSLRRSFPSSGFASVAAYGLLQDQTDRG